MEKQIIFTLSERKYGMKWKTTSALADASDKEINTVACMVASDMNRLTNRYNKRDIAVLFEVE